MVKFTLFSYQALSLLQGTTRIRKSSESVDDETLSTSVEIDILHKIDNTTNTSHLL